MEFVKVTTPLSPGSGMSELSYQISDLPETLRVITVSDGAKGVRPTRSS